MNSPLNEHHNYIINCHLSNKEGLVPYSHLFPVFIVLREKSQHLKVKWQKRLVSRRFAAAFFHLFLPKRTISLMMMVQKVFNGDFQSLTSSIWNKGFDRVSECLLNPRLKSGSYCRSKSDVTCAIDLLTCWRVFLLWAN